MDQSAFLRLMDFSEFAVRVPVPVINLREILGI